ncbi:MAG TPA: phage antirepressor N-terminal domain-containing protein [Herpetosiphonaceae bacterium]
MINEPIETLAVTFFEQPVLAARLNDGTIVLSIRDLCTATGLNLSSQLRRLRADEDLRDGMHRLRVSTAGGPQEQDFLILEFVPAWISSVNRARATTVVRERLRYLRLFSIRQVYDAIAQSAGLPSGPSSNIEDLADLQQYDEAITGIAQRQRALEESQDKARQVWRDHEQRLRRLEEQLGTTATVSPSQRGHIYQCVQLWAQARVEHENLSAASAFAGCWAALKTRYQVAKYEHIPASQYRDCIAYMSRAYQKLTGQPFPEAAPEEQG